LSRLELISNSIVASRLGFQRDALLSSSRNEHLGQNQSEPAKNIHEPRCRSGVPARFSSISTWWIVEHCTGSNSHRPPIAERTSQPSQNIKKPRCMIGSLAEYPLCGFLGRVGLRCTFFCWRLSRFVSNCLSTIMSARNGERCRSTSGAGFRVRALKDGDSVVICGVDIGQR
jgi:hypothetical protein